MKSKTVFTDNLIVSVDKSKESIYKRTSEFRKAA